VTLAAVRPLGRAGLSRTLLTAVAFCSLLGCPHRPTTPTHAELATVGGQQDALALCDALEALIAERHDTLADREYAYEVVRRHDEDTAATQFARAAVTGRLVQRKGLLAANLVAEIERAARRSRELDPTFRDGAATRLLGTLYVIAPAALLEHGDSEQGLALLEELTAARPDVPENHLRLAEAYIALGDASPAGPHLCFCLAHQTALRADDRILLGQLVAQAGRVPCAVATVCMR
jgi:hypothetical protein